MKLDSYIESLEDCNLKPSRPDMPSFKEAMLATVDIWCNDACRGYAIEAAQRMGMDKEQIHTLIIKMTSAFDDLTVDEAAEIFARY